MAQASYDTLDHFVALVGGFCSVPLAIIYPVAMHTSLARRPPEEVTISPEELRANWAVGCLGVAICVATSGIAVWTWPRG